MKDDQSPVFEPLEPRILLSATPVEDNNQEVVSTTITDEVKQETNLTLLIVDSQVESYQSLLKEIDSQIIIEFLEPSKDGVEQISSILSKYNNLSSLHILSHGSDSSISLGKSTLNQTSLSSYSSSLSQWKNSFKTGGDVLFYGCNIAKTKSFINELSSIISLDVAASDDLTGATSKNADAILEYNQGQIESKSLFSQKTFNSHVTLLAENNIDSSFFTVKDINTFEDNPTDIRLPITLGERYTVGGSRANVYDSQTFDITSNTSIDFVRGNSSDDLNIRFYITNSESIDVAEADLEERFGQIDIQINNKNNTISASYNDYDDDVNNYSFISKPIIDDNTFYNPLDFAEGSSVGVNGSKFFQFKRNGDTYSLSFISPSDMAMTGYIDYSSSEDDSLKKLSTQSRTVSHLAINFDLDTDVDVMFLDFSGSTRRFSDPSDENITGAKVTIRRYDDGKLYANGIIAGSYGTDGGGKDNSFNYYFEDYEIKTVSNHALADRIIAGSSSSNGDKTADLFLDYKLYINSTTGKFQIWGNLNSATNPDGSIDLTRRTQSSIVLEQYKRTGAGSVAVELFPSIVEYQNDRLDGDVIHYRYRIPVGAEQGAIKLSGFFVDASNLQNQNKERATITLDLQSNTASGYYFAARSTAPVMGSYNTVSLQEDFVSLTGNESPTNNGSVEALKIRKDSDEHGDYIELTSTTLLTSFHPRPDNSFATWQGLEPLRLKNWGSTKFIGERFVRDDDGSYLVSPRDILNNFKFLLEPPDNYNGSYTVRGEVQLGFDTTVSSFIDITASNVNDKIKLDGIHSLRAAKEYTVKELLSFSINSPKSNNNNIAISNINSMHGTWQFSIDGGVTFTDISNVSENNALLLENSDLIRFNHVANVSDLGELAIFAWDGSGGLSAGNFTDLTDTSSLTNPNSNIFSEISDIVTLKVFKDNHPPTIDVSNLDKGTFLEGNIAKEIASDVTIADLNNNDIAQLVFNIIGFYEGDVLSLSGEDFIYSVASTKKIIINSTEYDVIYDGKNQLSLDASSNAIALADVNTFVQSLTYNNISEDSPTGKRIVYLTVFDNHATEPADKRAAISEIEFITVNDAPIISIYQDQAIDEVVASVQGTVKVMHRDAFLDLVEQDDLVQNVIINITNVQDINREFLKIEGKDINLTSDNFSTLTTESNMNLLVEYDASTSVSQITISSLSGVKVSKINSMLAAMLYFNTSDAPTIGSTNKRMISLSVKDNGGIDNGGNDISDGDTLSVGNQFFQIKSIELNNDASVLIDLNGLASGSSYETTYVEDTLPVAINEATVFIPSGSRVRYLDLDLNQFQQTDQDVLIIDGKEVIFGVASSFNVSHGGNLTYDGETSITIDWNLTGIDEIQIQDFIRNIKFLFNGKNPVLAPRLISQGVETTSGQFSSRQSTINIEKRDSSPEITLSKNEVSYQENSSAVELFDEVVVDVFEDSQNISSFEFTMTNIENGGEKEFITIFGTSYQLNTDSVIEIENLSGTKVGVFEIFNTGNSADFVFSFDDPSILPEPSVFQSLLRSMTYYSTNETFTNLSRTIEFTLLQDSGNNINGHENSADFTTNPVKLTIDIIPVNDEPIIINEASNPKTIYTEGDGETEIFGSLAIDAIDRNVTKATLNLNISNVIAGDKITVNANDISLDASASVQTYTLASGEEIEVEITFATDTAVVLISGSEEAINEFETNAVYSGVDEATEVETTKTFTQTEQKVKAVLTIDNIVDGDAEKLTIDGTEFDISKAVTETETTNAKVEVAFSSGTATITILGKSADFLEVSVLETLLNGIKYTNTSEDVTENTKTLKAVITDDGSNTSPNDAIGEETTIGEINTITVNSIPTFVTQEPLVLDPDETSIGQIKAEDDGKLTYEITDVIGPVVTDEDGNEIPADEIFIIDEETGEITINPKVSLEKLNGKEFTIKVTITDEEGAKVSKDFTLTSHLPKLNNKGSNSSDLQLGSKGKSFVIPTPTDKDNDVLTTYITKLPEENEGKIFYKGEELIPVYDEEGNLLEIQTISGEVISSITDGIGISVDDLDKFEFIPANGFSGIAELGYGVSDGLSLVEGSYYFNVPRVMNMPVSSSNEVIINDLDSFVIENSKLSSDVELLESASEFGFESFRVEFSPAPFDSTLQNKELSEFNISTKFHIKLETIDRVSIFSFISRLQKPESFGSSISRMGLSTSINVNLLKYDYLKIDLQELFRKSYLNEAEKLFLKNSGIDEILFQGEDTDKDNQVNGVSLSQNDLDFIASINKQILDDFKIDS